MGDSEKIYCANCGIEIRWQPTIVNGKTYCCLGCSRGGPCTCDYRNLPSPDDATTLALRSQKDGKLANLGLVPNAPASKNKLLTEGLKDG